jgi:hypothetical protein
VRIESGLNRLQAVGMCEKHESVMSFTYGSYLLLFMLSGICLLLL